MRNPKNNANQTNDELMNNRKKRSKKGKIILITAIILCAIIIGAVVGFAIEYNNSLTKKSYNLKVYSVAEMLITLPGDFKAESKEGFTACYNNKNIKIET